MPFYLPPISRRQFLGGALAAFFSGRLRSRLAFAADADPHGLALLADTHIAADRAVIFKDVNMADHLAAVVKEIVAWKDRPAVGLIVGDLAQKTGETGDYTTFVSLLKPLREAGLPLHLTLGNHDHRDHFRAGTFENGIRPAGGRITEVIELPRANLFVLDTLDQPDGVPGRVGAEQLAWLAKALDERPDKPAIVVGHHDPMFETPPPDKKPSGLLDTAELFKLLEPRKQVKAYVYGHTHAWGVKEHGGIHLVNLPPTSYPFVEGKPTGWVHAMLRPDGARFEMRCLDAKHPQHGQVADLKWRQK
jgi:metallophosphoesterase superfamily enzyme